MVLDWEESEPSSHEQCSRKPWIPQAYPAYTQTTLINDFGMLSIKKPLVRNSRYRCTPAPHVVRRIANEVIFSTNDRSLTTFLRFPAEMRIEIYRLLLTADKVIKYQICTTTQRLVLSTWGGRYRKSRPWIRHGIFPSILSCCRLIHLEGSDVLYGENLFSLERESSAYYPIVTSLPLSTANLISMTKVHVQLSDRPRWETQWRRWKLFTFFPKLKEVKLEFRDVSPSVQKGLLDVIAREAIHKLRLEFEFNVTNDYLSVYRDTPENSCRKMYEPNMNQFQIESRKQGNITSEFQEHEDDKGLEYSSQVRATLFFIVA